MALSAVIRRPPNLRFKLSLLVFLFLWGGQASVCLARAFDANDCQKRLENIEEAKSLLTLPAFASFQKTGSILVLSQDLATWSTDLLVRLSLRLEQEWLPRCSSGKWPQVPQLLKQAYLAKLGINEVSQPNLDLLFRGLVTPKSEVDSLRSRILPEMKKLSPMELLSRVYQAVAGVVDGIVVIAPSEATFMWVKQEKDSLCPQAGACPFWDPRIIERLVFVTDSGVGAFVAEFGVLAVSREVLDRPNLLSHIVFTHELTHTAVLSTLLFRGKDWRVPFFKFSGWKQVGGKWQTTVKDKGNHPADELTRLSEGSSFSVLPDKIYKPTRASALRNGFVLGKSYEQSVQRNDPSEDLADSVAVFHWYPERYCLKHKNIALDKAKWIIKEVFSGSGLPICK